MVKEEQKISIEIPKDHISKIMNFLILEYFEKDEPIFQDLMPGGLKRDVQGVYPTTAPGLGANVTEDFLRKYKFDAAKTDEMERRTFNTLK